MIRIISIHIILTFFLSNSLFAKSNKKEREISNTRVLENVADSLQEKEEYTNAVNKYYKAAILFEKHKLWADAIRNYRKTSWCYFSLNKLDSAQFYIYNSLKLFNKKIKTIDENCKLELSEIYYIQARFYRDKGEFDSTIYFLKKGFEILNNFNEQDSSYHFLLAKYYQTYGTANYYKGNYDASLKYNFKALDIRLNKLENDRTNIISSYDNIALVYLAKKDSEKAIQYFLHVINNCTKENRDFEAKSYTNIGIANYYTHKYNKALDYYYKALDIYNKDEKKNSLNIAHTMNNIGKVYYKLGDYKKALEKINISINLRKKNLGEFHPILSNTLLSLGEYYCQIDEYENAINSFLEAIEIIDKNESSDIILKNQLYNLIGTTYIKQNKLNKALEYFQYAIGAIIDGYEYNNNLDNPKLFFKGTNIINDKMEILSKTDLYINLINKARTLFQFYKNDKSLTNKLQESLNTYDLAFQLMDVIRLEISTDKSKYILSKENKINFEEAIEISLTLDNLFPEKQYDKYALKFIDKYKSSSLQDKSYITNALNNSNIPEKLIEKERKIVKELAFYKTELDKSNQEVKNQKLENYKKIHDNLSIEYDTICNYFEKTYPEYYNLIHFNEFDINKIKSRIKEGEIVIEYFVTDSNILIATIDNKDYSITQTPIDSTFKQNVIKYYRSLRKVEISNYRHCNSILYQTLIKPIEDKIDSKKSLIIIPDDYLFYIPYETLYDNTYISDNFDFRNLNYLIKDYEIKYNYSLNLWLFNKNLNKNKENFIGEFMGFAPVFEDEDNILAVNLKNSDTTTRTIVIDGKRFSKLLYSEKEINEISRLFLERNEKANTYLYNRATESNFKKNISQYKYIHLSTHGFLDKNNPNLSGLAFYNCSNKDTTGSLDIEDGLLYSSEISSLDLNANLVVLSSCEGGLGKLVEGEGLIAISRDFISSGTPNIMYSLWNVVDKNTSELMIEFYREVLAGESYSQSLRKVKLKMIENINTCHPKIWSAFILIGI